MFPTRMSLNVWGVATQHSLQLPPQSGRVCNFMTYGSLLTIFFPCTGRCPGSLVSWAGGPRSTLLVPLSMFLSFSLIAMITIFSSSTLPIDYIRIIEIKGNFDITKMQQATCILHRPNASDTEPTHVVRLSEETKNK
jgi:hypothetical protein